MPRDINEYILKELHAQNELISDMMIFEAFKAYLIDKTDVINLLQKESGRRSELIKRIVERSIDHKW